MSRQASSSSGELGGSSESHEPMRESRSKSLRSNFSVIQSMPENTSPAGAQTPTCILYIKTLLLNEPQISLPLINVNELHLRRVLVVSVHHKVLFQHHWDNICTFKLLKIKMKTEHLCLISFNIVHKIVKSTLRFLLYFITSNENVTMLSAATIIILVLFNVHTKNTCYNAFRVIYHQDNILSIFSIIPICCSKNIINNYFEWF